MSDPWTISQFALHIVLLMFGCIYWCWYLPYCSNSGAVSIGRCSGNWEQRLVCSSYFCPPRIFICAWSARWHKWPRTVRSSSYSCSACLLYTCPWIGIWLGMLCECLRTAMIIWDGCPISLTCTENVMKLHQLTSQYVRYCDLLIWFWFHWSESFSCLGHVAVRGHWTCLTVRMFKPLHICCGFCGPALFLVCWFVARSEESEPLLSGHLSISLLRDNIFATLARRVLILIVCSGDACFYVLVWHAVCLQVCSLSTWIWSRRFNVDPAL